MGFSRQEYWSELPYPFPGDLPNPGIEPKSPLLAGGLYCLSHQGSLSKCRLNFIRSCWGVFQRGCPLWTPTRKVPEIGCQSWEEVEVSEPTPGVPVGQTCMSLGRAPLTVSPGCLIAPHPHQRLVLSDILNIFFSHFTHYGFNFHFPSD